jgi:hypothetical protein
MIESLFAVSEGGVGLAIVGVIGGLVSGVLLMFYRDVAASERMSLLPEPFANRFWDPMARQFWIDKLEPGSMWKGPVGNESQFRVDSSEWLRSGIASVKATTFLLGVVVLGSSLTLIPFGGLGINGASWILAGLVVGACVEHAVWLLARIRPRLEGEERKDHHFSNTREMPFP